MARGLRKIQPKEKWVGKNDGRADVQRSWVALKERRWENG